MPAPSDKYIGKEVFVVGVDDTNPSGPLEVFDSAEEMFTYLKTQIEIGVDADVRVLHGVLTKADTLPHSTRGKAGFLLAFDEYMESTYEANAGCIVEQCFSDVNELANEIENMVGTSIGPIATVDIDYLYILYGYELKTFVNIDLEDLDEENIDVCKKIALETEEVRKKSLAVST